jgi:hypothetical protein
VVVVIVVGGVVAGYRRIISDWWCCSYWCVVGVVVGIGVGAGGVVVGVGVGVGVGGCLLCLEPGSVLTKVVWRSHSVFEWTADLRFIAHACDGNYDDGDGDDEQMWLLCK